jgi:hypothetical protein
LSCQQRPGLSDKNYFIILENNQISHTDDRFDPVEMFFLISKRLNPQLEYKDMTISNEGLKERIVKRLTSGNLHLFHLNSRADVVLKDIIGISRVYFIHAACSSCQLKALFSHLKLKHIMDDSEKSIIMFSVFADSFSLKQMLNDSNLKMPIYLDINDNFNLFSTITNEKENPLIIDLETEDIQ